MSRIGYLLSSLCTNHDKFVSKVKNQKRKAKSDLGLHHIFHSEVMPLFTLPGSGAYILWTHFSISPPPSLFFYDGQKSSFFGEKM
jgi:hypothetical protein